ncbi:retrovirus-related pol polyprotein from transposon TNT 1-94, partial [Tanacetum coccineum]
MCIYALTVSTMEPRNVNEAVTDPAWIDSMQEEIIQLKRLDVCVLVPAPDNIKPLTLKWLFKNKHGEENTVIQNKTRLVVRGYPQEEGNYQDIFGLRCTQIVHCISNGRKNCFLACHVYKLKKALYGLNQAPRAWYDKLSKFLLQNHVNKVFVARNGHFLEGDFLYKEINRDVDLLKPVDEEQTKEAVEEVSQQQIVQAQERAIAAVDETQSIHISQRAHFQPERYYGFVIGRVDLSKPVTYYEAVSENEVAHWQDAIKTEMQSMYDNQVWELVDLPLTGRSERSKWVFKKKI